jgi:O-glycosyl hydrolase
METDRRRIFHHAIHLYHCPVFELGRTASRRRFQRMDMTEGHFIGKGIGRFTVVLLACLAAADGVVAESVTYVDPATVITPAFEGWGTSLCWWANMVGSYPNRTNYVDLAFGELGINIVRYNIGGGENPAIQNTLQVRARIPGFESATGLWNWRADANQRWVLKAAVARGVTRVDAFANSPPYWMTVSGSVTGSVDGTSDNLRTDHEGAFADYLTAVVTNVMRSDGVRIDSLTPMNEPTSSWWKKGNGQEGCHMGPAQQARMVQALRTRLDAVAPGVGVVASEDNDEQSAINSLNAYPASAAAALAGVVTHTYGANNPGGLSALAASLGKSHWVSEYGDGDGSGMTMARRIRDDLVVYGAQAWVYWQFVDNAGGWGLLSNPLDGSGASGYTIQKKYHAFGQFSRFIRPGAQILGAPEPNTVAAYHPATRTLTLVVVNDTGSPLPVAFDLNAFAAWGESAARWRTSTSEDLAVLPAVRINGGRISDTLPADSVTTFVADHVVAAGSVISINDGTTGTGLNQFNFNGSWSYGAQAGAFGGDNHWSWTPNNTWQVTVEGRQIGVYGAKAPIHGIGAVSIDHGPETLIDYYSPTRIDNALVWAGPVLAAGRHTVQVRVTGTKNAASTGTVVPADRVWVRTSDPTLLHTLTQAGSAWRAWGPASASPGNGWAAQGFDDSGWRDGPAPFGLGLPGVATTLSAGGTTAYFRTAFGVDPVRRYSGATLRLLRDAGAVVYMNGAEVFRSGMPDGVITPTTPAVKPPGPFDRTNYFSAPIPVFALAPGSNTVAVEVHAATSNAGELAFDLELDATNQPTFPFIAEGGPWRRWTTAGNPGATWTSPDIDDSTWEPDTAPVGYGNGNESTVIPPPATGPAPTTVYLRHDFQTNGEPAINLKARLRFRDGVVAYLNGQEFYRANLPAGAVGSTTFATVSTGSESALTPVVSGNIRPALLRPGNNVLAVELHRAPTHNLPFMDLALDGFAAGLVPALSAGPANGSLLLNWPALATDFDLYSGASIQGSNVWTRLSTPGGPPVTLNPEGFGDAAFFRLSTPP